MSKMRQAIIVLGMHRSGTSALTGALGLLGIRLPAQQMAPLPENPKGFFESERITAIDDRVLAALGTTWSGVDRIPAEWFRSAPAASFREELAAALEADYDDAALFVLKDPRMCRLLPLWRQVFARVGVEPCFAITIRHPLDVAHSLEKRNGLPLAHGCILWLSHLLEAERETRGLPRVFVRYEDLLGEPALTAKRIGIELGLGNLLRGKKRERDLAAFIDPALRHHSAETGVLEQRGSFYPLLSEAFDALIALGRSPGDAEAQWRLDCVRVSFEKVMTSIDVADREIWINSSRICEAFDAAMATVSHGQGAAEVQVGKSMAKLSDFSPIGETAAAGPDSARRVVPAVADAHGGEESFSAASARLQAIQAELASHPSHLNVVPASSELSVANIERLNRLLRQRSARIGYLYAVLADYVAVLRNAEDMLGHKERETTGLRLDLAARVQQIESLQQHLLQEQRNAERQGEDIKSLQTDLVARAQQLELSQLTVTAREEELAGRRADIAELQARLASASQAIEDLRGIIVQKSLASWEESAARSREVEVLRDELANMSLHLANARKENEVVRNAFLNSHSWRLTGPLRWLSRLFGG